MSQMRTGVAIAAAAAALFAMGATTSVVHAAADAPTVKCAGVNSCKGQSECKSATNECKGQNTCKGHGWVTKASAKECTDAGGKVAP